MEIHIGVRVGGTQYDAKAVQGSSILPCQLQLLPCSCAESRNPLVFDFAVAAGAHVIKGSIELY